MEKWRQEKAKSEVNNVGETLVERNVLHGNEGKISNFFLFLSAVIPKICSFAERTNLLSM